MHHHRTTELTTSSPLCHHTTEHHLHSSRTIIITPPRVRMFSEATKAYGETLNKKNFIRFRSLPKYTMSGEEPTTQIAPVESPQMVSTIKLPILKKGEYTLWSMRMEQYLTNTDYSLWQVDSS
ncbi:hypothetical protein Tco_1561174 [Tanacetum coccineum]